MNTQLLSYGTSQETVINMEESNDVIGEFGLDGKKSVLEAVELPIEVESPKDDRKYHSGKAGKPKDNREHKNRETSRKKAQVSSKGTEQKTSPSKITSTPKKKAVTSPSKITPTLKKKTMKSKPAKKAPPSMAVARRSPKKLTSAKHRGKSPNEVLAEQAKASIKKMLQ
eukprot:14043290-Ditylum_brightwellii.AAC.1